MYKPALLKKFPEPALNLAKQGTYVLYTNKDESRIMVGIRGKLRCGCCAGAVETVFVSNENFEFSNSQPVEQINLTNWTKLDTQDRNEILTWMRNQLKS